MDERERLEGRVKAARAGHQRTRRDPAYADAVRARLERRAARLEADQIWADVYGTVDSLAARALLQWLDDSSRDIEWLARSLAAAETSVTPRVLLTQHPHSGTYFEWSTPPTPLPRPNAS